MAQWFATIRGIGSKKFSTTRSSSYGLEKHYLGPFKTYAQEGFLPETPVRRTP
jgi:hypothetical protein